MANENLHLSQAYHNTRLAKHILDNNCMFPDWVITSCFYSALHFFEAHLFKRNATHGELEAKKEGITPHLFRKRFINENHNLIYRKWAELYNACNMARYLINLPKPAYEYFTEQSAIDFKDKMDRIRHHFGYIPNPR